MNLMELSSIEVMRHVLFALFGMACSAPAGYMYAKLLKKNKALQESNDELQKSMAAWKESAEDCMPVYLVRRIWKTSCKHPGSWAVCRMSIRDGMMYDTCIKVFTDDDDDFNYNEAVELCDKLNEK